MSKALEATAYQSSDAPVDVPEVSARPTEISWPGSHERDAFWEGPAAESPRQSPSAPAYSSISVQAFRAPPGCRSLSLTISSMLGLR